MATIEEICEVLKVHAQGKTVQIRDVHGDWTNFQPDIYTTCYLQKQELRIKPEPLEVWAVVGKKENIVVLKNKEEAYIYKDCYDYDRVSKFREVTDESE